MNPNILLVECADRPGLVHGITGVLFRRGLNVVSNHEFVDRAAGRFFMRTEFDGEADSAALESEVRAALPVDAQVRCAHPAPKRVVALVSREHHCLGDLLVRHAFNELNARLLAVVGNHPVLSPLVEKFDLPFHWVTHEGRSREEHEAELLALLAGCQPDYLVLAKYMRILSPEFVRHFPARIINIHHSFLPAFVGARPYHQAFARGVKVIGATAHFVTDALDQGPIIVQQVMPVDHTHSPEDMAQAGRDVEQLALAKALRLVFEDRVFLCGNRTVIFD
jgi:formyltetrahydrofolate deformylase